MPGSEPSLHDPYVRLDGARKDLDALERDIERFLRDDVYSVLNEEDPEVAGYRIAGVRIASPPPDWGRRAGHIVNDLRSALDYLVYQLAWLDSGTRQDGTQFPICDTNEALSPELKKGRLRGLSGEHVNAICMSQPVNGAYWLARLRDLSNPDKHRHLNTAISEAWPPVPSVNAMSTLCREDKPYPLMHEVRNRGLGPPLANHLQVEMDISVGVAFSDGAPVVETLHVFEAGARELVDSFQPAFERT